MNELTVPENKSQRMTSIEVAEITGKQHLHVMRDIRTLIDQGAIGESNFGLSSYINSQNKSQPMYSLDFKASMVLVTGYDAVKRAAVIDRWVALETGAAKPAAITVKDADDLFKMDKGYRALLRTAKAIGLKGNFATISANQAARKIMGVDVFEVLAIESLPTTVQEQVFTPTQLGSFIGLSPRATNTFLVNEGFQVKCGDGYSPTGKGEPFAALIDTEKKHKSGAPVTQLKWKKSILENLKIEAATIN